MVLEFHSVPVLKAVYFLVIFNCVLNSSQNFSNSNKVTLEKCYIKNQNDFNTKESDDEFATDPLIVFINSDTDGPTISTPFNADEAKVDDAEFSLPSWLPHPFSHKSQPQTPQSLSSQQQWSVQSNNIDFLSPPQQSPQSQNEKQQQESGAFSKLKSFASRLNPLNMFKRHSSNRSNSSSNPNSPPIRPQCLSGEIIDPQTGACQAPFSSQNNKQFIPSSDPRFNDLVGYEVSQKNQQQQNGQQNGQQNDQQNGQSSQQLNSEIDQFIQRGNGQDFNKQLGQTMINPYATFTPTNEHVINPYTNPYTDPSPNPYSKQPQSNNGRSPNQPQHFTTYNPQQSIQPGENHRIMNDSFRTLPNEVVSAILFCVAMLWIT